MAVRVPRATIDFETKSEVDVRDVGAWRYAEDPTTEILCMSYRLPRAKTRTWVPGMPFPQDLISFIEAGGVCEAHNAQFERAVWINKLLPLGIPMASRWMDTLAVCAYKALPLGLDQVGGVLPLDVKKDKRGKFLLQKLSKPRKPNKADKKAHKEECELRGEEFDPDNMPVLWCNDWDLHEELYDYCDRDVDAEHSLSEMIGDLPRPEYRTWVMDQKINQRGVYVDLEAVRAAKEICTQIELKWNAELKKVTGGAVEKATQVARLKKFCIDNDVPVEGLGKDILTDVLATWELPDNVRRALEIRKELGMSSTAKIDKFLDCVNADFKVRGMLQYHGGGTGRWAGRLVQPQNFPRGSTKPDQYTHYLLNTTADTYGTIAEDDYDAARAEELIADIKLCDADFLELKYGSAMAAVSSALRGMMTASPGNRLLVADFSAIEAVVLAWICGEESKLEVFRRKEDPYCATGSAIKGFTVDKKIAKDPGHPDFKMHSEGRQLGKTGELAFGYQGGVGAWRNFDRSDTKTDDDINGYKDAWREKHPNITASWSGFEWAAINAVMKGQPTSYNGIVFDTCTDAAGKWMTIQLPNDRKLWYYDPQIHDDMTPWGKPTKKLSYQGKDNKRGGVWGRVDTYGGMLTENIVQAIARDLMVEAMFKVEHIGYKIIITIHDEIIADMPFGEGNLEEFQETMAYVPPWATGCPVAVDGWEGHRYRK